MSRRLTVTRASSWALAALALAAAACSRDAGTSDAGASDGSSHARMLAALAEVGESAKEENLYVGARRSRDARAELAALPTDAKPRERLRCLVALADAEARLGREPEAIEQWEAAYALLPALAGELSNAEATEVVYRLAIAHMRLGETENCCRRNTAESCLLPIRGGGLHAETRGSEQAVEYFGEVLERTRGQHLRARWLLNIAYMTLGRYPDGVPAAYRIPPRVFESEEAFPRFENVAPEMGLDTFSLYGGVVADDLDGDGYVDLLVSTADPLGQTRLFRNQRDGTFAEVTEAANLTGITGGLNMCQADYDNDGDVDVFVLRGAWLRRQGQHPNSLLRNDGKGRFTDVTFDVGLAEPRFPTQTGAWADYDNDGDVDLYVGNETDAGMNAPCQLFRNDGGAFTDVAAAAGVDNVGFCKGVSWGDYDGDRWPDLYVSNMNGPNRLYHNERDGTFVDVAPRLGMQEPRASFPIWWWDFDNDGALDLYVPSYRGEAGALQSVVASILGLPHDEELPRLYKGDGQGGFVDVAKQANLLKLTFPMGCNYGDLDNDGFLDFYHATGFPDYEALLPNVLYRNVGGERFADVTYAAGMGHLQKGHAVAFADLDHDGDQDVFVQMGGAFRGDAYNDCLFENPGGFGNHWIGLQLVGVRSNRSAIGARIRADVLDGGKRRTIYKHVNSGASFGTNPLRQSVGLGQATEIERLELYWPTSDTTQAFEHVPVDRFLRVTEGADAYETLDLPAAPLRASGSF